MVRVKIETVRGVRPLVTIGNPSRVYAHVCVVVICKESFGPCPHTLIFLRSIVYLPIRRLCVPLPLVPALIALDYIDAEPKNHNITQRISRAKNPEPIVFCVALCFDYENFTL